MDEESQTVMDETYQDDGRYCCGCRLSTIMISGCLIGLAMTIGAIAGLLIWDQALVESALGQSAQTPTMAPTVAVRMRFIGYSVYGIVPYFIVSRNAHSSTRL